MPRGDTEEVRVCLQHKWRLGYCQATCFGAVNDVANSLLPLCQNYAGSFQRQETTQNLNQALRNWHANALVMNATALATAQTALGLQRLLNDAHGSMYFRKPIPNQEMTHYAFV